MFRALASKIGILIFLIAAIQYPHQAAAIPWHYHFADGAANLPSGFVQIADERDIALLQLRIQELEEELRRLNGKVEELEYHLNRARQANTTPPAPTLSLKDSLEQRSNEQTPTGSNNADQPLAQSDPTTTENNSQPLDLSGLILKNERSISGDFTPLPENPDDHYDGAFSLMQQGNYIKAEDAFRDFLVKYPTHRRAANVQFWIGESLFAQQRYQEAANEFLRGYTVYPQNQKSPESLLKLGLSLKHMGELSAACKTFREVIVKHPQAPRSIQLRARNEQQQSQCG